MSDYYDAENMEEYYQALQRRINDGSIWSFEGSAGRAAMEALKEGFCMLGNEPRRDYWGNRIPSRHEILEGSFGSPEYVLERQGQEWLEIIAEAAQLPTNFAAQAEH